jgi:hypothetical protein
LKKSRAVPVGPKPPKPPVAGGGASPTKAEVQAVLAGETNLEKAIVILAANPKMRFKKATMINDLKGAGVIIPDVTKVPDAIRLDGLLKPLLLVAKPVGGDGGGPVVDPGKPVVAGDAPDIKSFVAGSGSFTEAVEDLVKAIAKNKIQKFDSQDQLLMSLQNAGFKMSSVGDLKVRQEGYLKTNLKHLVK